MLKAIIKLGSLLILSLTLLGLSGCTDPAAKRSNQLSKAAELADRGLYAEAIDVLEKLSTEFPNDTAILQEIGAAYLKMGDATMGAFFLEEAHRQDPGNVDLLFQTYRALEAAGQPAAQQLNQLAEISPESMTDALWIRLGQFRAENKQTESALQAYLKGADLQNRKPDPETASAIGLLFGRLGNSAQAERWLAYAADSDDPNALTALFGLLEIQLSEKRWTEAEATIGRLDKQFPGALEASQWAPARAELARWRAAQEAMRIKLAEAAARKEAEAKAAAEQPVEAIVEETPEESGQIASEGSTPAETSGKAQVIADMDAAEAMANQPALEATDADSTAATVAFNPDIAIEPADPTVSFNVTFDQEALAPGTTYAIDGSSEAAESGVPEAEFTAFGPETLSGSAGADRSAEPKTLEQLLAEAEAAELDRDFKAAIRKYWAAIGLDNSRAAIWNLLSRAYLTDGQPENAETAALEAIRLQPDEVAYTLDYLRIAQRTKTPEQFLSHLETAYDRFPASPEITLSLARAYERISRDASGARNLYLRFIDIAPGHPLVPEARDALSRLR